MASSTYQYLITVGENLPTEDSINSGISNSTITFNSVGKLDIQNNFAGSILGTVIHHCRETLLSHANQALNDISYQSSFMKFCTFLYTKEAGFSLQEARLTDIITLGEKITKSGPLKIHRVGSNNNIIAVSVPYRQNKDMQLASLLLYIFRNQQILTWLLEHIKEITSLECLLRILSREFLLHSEWGDNANPPLFLSMFCYAYLNTVSTTAHTYNGPCSFAKYLPTKITHDYFQRVYCPLLIELNGNMPFNSTVGRCVDATHLAPFVKAFYKKPRKKTVKTEARESEV